MAPAKTQKRKGSKPIQWNSRKRAKKATVPRTITTAPFPLRQTRTLTYCDAVILTPTAGDDVANHVFRANSIFDPDESGTGHQPYAHDTFMTLYSKYSVKSAVIDISFAPPTIIGDSNQAFARAVACGVWNNDFSTPITDPTLIREQPGSNSKVLTLNDVVTVRGAYLRDTRIPMFDAGEASATFGTNPAETIYFNVFAAGEAGANMDDQIITAFIKIQYEVEMWEPKKLGSS